MQSWWGDESRHWQEKVEAFEALRTESGASDPRRERIIAAGVARYSALRDRAARGEQQERIFGREAS